MPIWSEEGFNKILEAGKRGRERLIAQSQEEFAKKKQEYDAQPNLCLCCEKPLLFEQVLNKSVYCSRSCAAKVNNKKRVKLHSKCVCLNCGKDFSVKIKNHTGKYCSFDCGAKHKSELRMQAWLAGEVEVSANALRKYMAILKPHQCEVCGVSEWNGKPVPLEVDHIDGDHKNNTLDNLRRICPNCHAQTDTYKSKNRGKGRSHRRQRWKEGKTV
jgi:hypothetical protein